MEMLQAILTLAAVILAGLYVLRQALTRDGCTGCSGRCSSGSDVVPLSAIKNPTDSAPLCETPLTTPVQQR